MDLFASLRFVSDHGNRGAKCVISSSAFKKVLYVYILFSTCTISQIGPMVISDSFIFGLGEEPGQR